MHPTAYSHHHLFSLFRWFAVIISGMFRTIRLEKDGNLEWSASKNWTRHTYSEASQKPVNNLSVWSMYACLFTPRLPPRSLVAYIVTYGHFSNKWKPWQNIERKKYIILKSSRWNVFALTVFSVKTTQRRLVRCCLTQTILNWGKRHSYSAELASVFCQYCVKSLIFLKSLHYCISPDMPEIVFRVSLLASYFPSFLIF